ncbi:hypothetical protein G4B88_026204 [Cannabis sativa]|uniref:Transferase n=2 Tax=Cannabis sativa TaxID=3483 RepID=A0A7J6EW42_CANSA|nr:hypothetical protein G4B88_026813 [Cannabis sativa]KAF4352629.1 hypothetical protein G4B88_008798 [Cannabis sativa]KAF4362642.1 hypothetical protein G4B88_026204 [Cannabis sativa]
MDAMEVEILSREFVKPSNPTPDHLRDYKLCLLDQFIPEMHCALTLFYSASDSHFLQSDQNDNKNYCRILKKSLSDTLTDFYPIAGRFKDSSTIDCNDSGACVVEARINSNLSDFLTTVNQSKDIQTILGKLIPILDSETMELASKCMLIAQITVFNCGGVSISFCLEHRFCDFASVMVFLKSWSARARSGGGSGEIVLPDFVGSKFLPPQNMPSLPPPHQNAIQNRKITRLIFESSKISALKSKYLAESSSDHQNKKISGVEVVVGLIVKSAISATRSTKSLLLQVVKLRMSGTTEPPLSENAMGNFAWLVPVMINKQEENDTEFDHELITSNIKRETTSFMDEKVKRRIKGDEEGIGEVFKLAKERGEIMRSVADVDTYWCSTWCGSGVYGLNFGWGNPVWVSGGFVSPVNLIIIEDTKCGEGIQAWVSLDQNVMAIFEQDHELLSFASLNPTIN